MYQSLPNSKAAEDNAVSAEQGEVPSNMKSFWKFLLRKSLPADSLRSAQSAVFGLGDSGDLKHYTLCSHAKSRACEPASTP